MKPNTTHKNSTVQFMKTKLTMLKLLCLCCGMFATTAVFGQVLYTWSGAWDGVSLVNPTNWIPIGQPSGATQDTAEWNGLTTTNLLITYGTVSLPSTGFGSSGVNLVMTASQTNSVQVICTPATTVSAGIGINSVELDAGSAPFTWGDTTTNNLLSFGRPAGAVHSWMNNSANAGVINPSVKWQAGGGNGYTYWFNGTGNWNVTNYLMPDNGSFSANALLIDGPGIVSWTAGKTGTYNPNSALSGVTINGGALIVHSSGLFPNPPSQTVALNGASGVFEFDAAAQAQTLSGVISGVGIVQVNNGTLTLSGQSTYTGPTLLTGGELIVASAENPGSSGPLGTGSYISFTGGTLGFSSANTFDYSSRFTNSPGQAYSIDTAGLPVTFATALPSSGASLTKVGGGTLTLASANSYSGNTTISVGRLIFQGAMTGTGNINVADGATLALYDTGTQLKPGTLTLGTSSGAILGFFNVHSTTTAPLAPATLASSGTVTININSGTLAIGNSYPLMTWTTGPVPTVSLGVLNGFIGNLSFTGNTLYLNITATAYTWTGINNNLWDNTTANNWIQNGGPVVYGANGVGPALFDDTSAQTNVSVNAAVTGTTITVNNTANGYTITSSGANNIGGSASLSKSGTNTLTLVGGANTYTGVTTFGGGIVDVTSLANGGTASDIGAANNSAASLVFDGGTLQYTGAVVNVDHLFTLNPGGGAIDSSGSGPLDLSNGGLTVVAGTGPRTLTMTGTVADTNTLAAVLPDAPAGGAVSLTKNGPGNWILSGNNTYSGGTTINNGILQVGASPNGSLGSGPVVNNAAIIFNRTGTLLVPGVISGPGRVTNNGTGTVILANDNTYTGGTTVNAGTLQIGNGGATGKLDGASPVYLTNNAILVFNTTGELDMLGNGAILGSGNVIVSSSGLMKLAGNNTYTGWTLINAGATFQPCTGNAGNFASSVVTNNGTLKLVRQDNAIFEYLGTITGSGQLVKDVNNPNPGDVTLGGTNNYTGGTFINGGSIILGTWTNLDGSVFGVGGTISGNVTFGASAVNDTFRSLIFNHIDNYTFGGNIIGGVTNPPALANAGTVVQWGSNVLTLTGNNTYLAGTIVSNGVLQVGNGGTSGTIGTGVATVWSQLSFNRADNYTFGGGITGTGTVVQAGAGILTITSSNAVTGPTIASNGTLVVSMSGGDLDVSGGTVTAGGVGTVGTLNVGTNMNIVAGTVLATLNTSLAQSNTLFQATNGAVIATGGTLKLINVGPALTVGEKFTIFASTNAGVTGGGSITIVSPGGYTFANNLATDGSVTVTAVTAPGSPTITAARAGANVNLSWPAAWTGMHLQAQTNTLRGGLQTGGIWFNIPGTDLSNTYSSALLIRSNTAVFYRLVP